MRAWKFDPIEKRIEFSDGTRIVSSTDGTLFNLLPIAHGYTDTVNAVFPDFDKDYLYVWDWASSYSQLNSIYIWASHGIAAITAIPQEWSNTTILAAAPAGADVFLCKIRLNRTSAPSHDWGGQALDVLPVEGQWIPLNGSILLEAEFGMCRSLSVYIEGGNLVLHQQQSVSTPPGGYGVQPGGVTAPLQGFDKSGGEVVFDSEAGMPVWTGVGSPYDKTSSGTHTGTAPNTKCRTHRISGSDPCSTADPTDYGDTYQLEISGQFGRRS